MAYCRTAVSPGNGEATVLNQVGGIMTMPFQYKTAMDWEVFTLKYDRLIITSQVEFRI